MGAFCVFGISRSACKAEATRRTPTYVIENGERRDLTMAEWAARRDEMAASLFEHGEKPARISPELDAPQFCHDWLAAGPCEVRSPVVMVRGGQGGQERESHSPQWRPAAHVEAIRPGFHSGSGSF